MHTDVDLTLFPFGALSPSTPRSRPVLSFDYSTAQHHGSTLVPILSDLDDSQPRQAPLRVSRYSATVFGFRINFHLHATRISADSICLISGAASDASSIANIALAHQLYLSGSRHRLSASSLLQRLLQPPQQQEPRVLLL